ncbi:NAD-glutamate dehydrogenase [Antrihabitans sp. YC2-6]|uniref:NAD-glutamate dehydrogenase n=1 Tax=Antrihabitans sp. YC2-6 TaxID=2799498 RepID=UPI0018F4C327|nr:NAD-glutamate dehydrogenase [Antrihabitans sp. YC2-6]MBJ8346759.1 NAD-glutamate dehydrogenase [Antrihabitans sp. YC2-6]
MTASPDLIDSEWAAKLPDGVRSEIESLEGAYFRHVDAGDADCAIVGSSAKVFARHLDMAMERTPGQAISRVYRPDDEYGLGAAVQIVNDDMPLLVESITSMLGRHGVSLSEVIHPIFDVWRDDKNRLVRVLPHDVDNTEDDGRLRESWMHVQLHPSTDPALLDRIAEVVPDVLADVRQVVDDTDAMRGVHRQLAEKLDSAAAAGESHYSADDLTDCANLLRWLAEGHYTVLGYSRYERNKSDRSHAHAVEGTQLGVLRAGVLDRTHVDIPIPPPSEDRPLLVLTQGSTPATVHRSVYPYFVGVAAFDDSGAVVGEHLFVGVFTVTALHENVLDIPVIASRVRAVIDRAGFDINSFSGQAMLEVIQSFPRTELFSSDADTLFKTTSSVLNVGMRRQVRLFLREDAYGRFVSCLVYLPRDRYTTRVRLAMQDILVRELGGTSIEYSARVTESDLANVHFTVRRTDVTAGASTDMSEEKRVRIQDMLAQASRTWDDYLSDEVSQSTSVLPALAQQYADAFPEAYKQDFGPRRALADIERLEGLQEGAIDLHLYRDDDAEKGHWQFSLYIGGTGVSLSQVLPVLQSLGVEVLDERPYRISLADSEQWIYDFGIVAPPELLRGALDQEMDDALNASNGAMTARVTELQERFSDAFEAVWYGLAEADSFNELVLRSGLQWREAAVLRAYAKYLRQAGFPYSHANIARVLLTNPGTAVLFVQLFVALFDPDNATPDRAQELEDELRAKIDAVVSLDADRILRAILGLIRATLRTNYFVVDSAGTQRPYLSFKVEPREIVELPKPKPRFEVFVYSPRVEGVHLRFGRVARGGLRWSDRQEDFRTEILGLVKAQAVKNAVIVPVGAKGGFVVKNPPRPTDDDAADRQAFRDEGIACYKLFISGLLDVTDNVDRVTGKVLPPARVVRRDDDDTYLVVAADKGTATFSDIANGVAKEYGFWLGDAFASGGSAGYDHKAMGITAKGAWESVKRHFSEIDVDTQAQEFTVVGVGDMSGDVFGNGMLLSPHIRLVAAFDHRHIFLDPNPVAATSFTERERMFALPRSSWADYDETLISEGGGIYDKTVKSVPISPQVRIALGLGDDVTSMSPPELVKAILLAPVDLLWNGGIGTYIKASTEANADVGDKANDPVRVNGSDLRVKVIGEGGNLGATALGRIEFCHNGGKMNTDALDNSAGVDCSDHEVNIKIMLDRLVSSGDLEEPDRNPLLASMTDEVARLVLDDNISQNFLMGISRAESVAMLSVHSRVIADLERTRALDRELEALPSEAEIIRRKQEGGGLTSPELSNLMAHVKLAMKDDLLKSDVPDMEVFSRRLPSYFPIPLQERFGKAIKLHPLRREIVTTMIANETVDFGGITYAYRLFEEAGARSTDSVRAYAAAVEIFDLRSLWKRIRSADMSVRLADELELESKRTLDRASRWLLMNRPQPIAVGAEINRFSRAIRELGPKVPGWLQGHRATSLEERARAIAERGVPADLAQEVLVLLDLFPLMDIFDISDITDRDGDEVGELYYALDAYLGVDWLLTAVSGLARGDRWHALARLALRDDLYSSLRSLTLDVLVGGEADESPQEKIEYWESTNQSRLGRARASLAEIFEAGTHDLATLSVAARQVRSMVSGVGSQSEANR